MATIEFLHNFFFFKRFTWELLLRWVRWPSMHKNLIIIHASLVVKFIKLSSWISQKILSNFDDVQSLINEKKAHKNSGWKMRESVLWCKINLFGCYDNICGHSCKVRVNYTEWRLDFSSDFWRNTMEWVHYEFWL